MKYPMDAEQVARVFKIQNKTATVEAERLIIAVCQFANEAYADGYKAGRADAEKHGKAVK